MAGTKQKSSNAMSQSQASNTYALATRTRRTYVKGIDAKKLQLAFSTSSSLGWELTSNPRVIARGK
jgi:hypothetical protein